MRAMNPAIEDLFASTSEGPTSTVEQHHLDQPPHQRAIAAIRRVMEDGHIVQAQFSSGKDSSALVNLVLSAALEIQATGATVPPIYICHVDVGVENPEVRSLADRELAKIDAFAKKHRLPVKIHVGKPALNACFATRIIGGRALPPFPGVRRDCSTDWKIVVSQRLSRRIRERHAGAKVITLIGTRSSESTERAINTAKRGETAHQVWASQDGSLMLSPIVDWQTDELWEYLGEASAGWHPAYSDFRDMMDYYAAAGGSTCAVIGDLNASSKACGARGGCFVCTAVALDHSVHNMIRTKPDRYDYLKPLMNFRDFMADTQWDWSRRNFIGRTIDSDGFISVKADQYSPLMCEQLLRYALAAQDDANRMGSPSHVKIVGLRELFAIDFYWSARAWHPPFHALWVYLDHCAGNVQRAPKGEHRFAPSPLPNIGAIHVGDDWDDQSSPLYPGGMRDPAWETHFESCGPRLRTSAGGKVFLMLEEGPEFDVDMEGASLFLEFEAENMIERFHRGDVDWTIGASTYLRYGTVTIGEGQSAFTDKLLRRSQWLQRHDLHGHQTAQALRARCDKWMASQEELFA